MKIGWAIAWGVSVGVFLGAGAPVCVAAESSAIIVNLEEPSAGDVKTGISNLRGWAVAPTQIVRVELMLDGTHVFDVPFGAQRLDVCGIYDPVDYPGACQSGFSMAYNYSNLAAGTHEAAVRVVDVNGDWNTAARTFSVTRFPSSFIPDAGLIDLSDSFPALVSPNQFILGCLLVDGDYYDVQLVWDTKKQDWKTEIIANSNLDCPPQAAVHGSSWIEPAP